MKRDVAHLVTNNHYFPTIKENIFNFSRQQPPQWWQTTTYKECAARLLLLDHKHTAFDLPRMTTKSIVEHVPLKRLRATPV